MLSTSKIRKYIHKRLLENASKYQIFDELNYELNDHSQASNLVRNMPYTRNQKWIPRLNRILVALIAVEVIVKLLMYSNDAGKFSFYATADYLNVFTLTSAFLLYFYYRYDGFLYKFFLLITILNIGTITIYDQYHGFWLFMDWSILTVMAMLISFILIRFYPHLIWKKLGKNLSANLHK